MGNILTFVSSKVSGVINDIIQNQNVVEELVHTPIQQVIEEVSGGIWTGDGATAFLKELDDLYLPDTQIITEYIGGLASGISAAADIIEQADKAASAVVDGLVDTFTSIF